MSEGLYLEDWVERVMNPAAAALQPDDLVVSMRLAAAEMLSSGTTTFFNHSVSETDLSTVAALAEASAATGIRQVFGKELRATVRTGDVETHHADVETLLTRYAGPVEDALFTVALAV
jgi:cytosine/adenosine deaminase-related metal-dependent hydrolase